MQLQRAYSVNDAIQSNAHHCEMADTESGTIQHTCVFKHYDVHLCHTSCRGHYKVVAVPTSWSASSCLSNVDLSD